VRGLMPPYLHTQFKGIHVLASVWCEEGRPSERLWLRVFPVQCVHWAGGHASDKLPPLGGSTDYFDLTEDVATTRAIRTLDASADAVMILHASAKR